MHNTRQVMIKKIEEKAVLRQYVNNHTFAENGDEVIEEVFGFDKFSCIRDLIMEASNEAVEELLIEELIE
jgi:hypothetical protein